MDWPLPDEAKVSLPGVDLASAISSRTLPAGRSGRVTITSGPLVSSDTGAKLLRVSEFRFLNSDMLMAWAVVASSSV